MWLTECLSPQVGFASVPQLSLVSAWFFPAAALCRSCLIIKLVAVCILVTIPRASQWHPPVEDPPLAGQQRLPGAAAARGHLSSLPALTLVPCSALRPLPAQQLPGTAAACWSARSVHSQELGLFVCWSRNRARDELANSACA